MERKIGEIFEYNDNWYQCIKSDSCRCDNCDFDELSDCDIIACETDERKDGKEVYFKKLEKVGEPYKFDGHLFQSYRTFEVPIFTENYATVRELGNNSKISIEIKQTKEDMEEYKMYDAKEDIPEFDKAVDECLFGKDKLNLKPFDLESAKADKPVYTRNGKKVRVICFDKVGVYPVIALVQEEGIETCHFYSQDGRCADCGSEYDLMMLCEKKKGYVNVYSTMIHATLEDADRARKDANNSNYIQTLEVEWEEYAEQHG